MSLPYFACTTNVHVKPPPLAAAHGLGVAIGKTCPGGCGAVVGDVAGVITMPMLCVPLEM